MSDLPVLPPRLLSEVLLELKTDKKLKLKVVDYCRPRILQKNFFSKGLLKSSEIALNFGYSAYPCLDDDR